MAPLVGVIMGSKTDWEILARTAEVLEELEIPFEARVVSAHRTPDATLRYAEQAEGRGMLVIVAGAGGAAHLPGLVAAKTTLPVLGVPIPATQLAGVDALLSMVQMPKGIPVGTLGIGKAGAENAALLAAAIVAAKYPEIRVRLAKRRQSNRDEVLAQGVLAAWPRGAQSGARRPKPKR